MGVNYRQYLLFGIKMNAKKFNSKVLSKLNQKPTDIDDCVDDIYDSVKEFEKLYTDKEFELKCIQDGYSGNEVYIGRILAKTANFRDGADPLGTPELDLGELWQMHIRNDTRQRVAKAVHDHFLIEAEQQTLYLVTIYT